MTTTIVPQLFRKPRVTGEDFPLSNHDAIHTRNVKTVKKHCACHHELVRITASCERQLPRTRRVGLERSLNGTGVLIGLPSPPTNVPCRPSIEFTAHRSIADQESLSSTDDSCPTN